MEFYGYKKCSTCRQAHKALAEGGIEVEFQDFVKDPPTRQQLVDWAAKTPGGVAHLANPRGTRYRELGLKEKQLTEEEWLDLLSQDGKLLKRPILVLDNADLVVGFAKEAYADLIAASK